MLETVGHPDLDALTDAAIPSSIRMTDALDIAPAGSEHAVLGELRGIAARNTVLTSMIGLGYHGTVTPMVIQRNVLENPGWYTAYTPYQPEISQGRLEALLNFQTVVSDLTGLATSGASLLDEATAVAEAMTLMRRTSRVADDAVLVLDTHLLPQSLAVTRTRARPLGLDVVVADLADVASADDLSAVAGGRPVFGVVVQYPGADGELRDWRAVTGAAHELGALVTAAADLLALTLATPPGEWGADVAVGTSQRFGVPMGFGGPHAGYMSVRGGLERSLPGRLVGASVDADGAVAYRLALQTREQHIRREKATSNICTAQVLLAVMASMYAVYHGPEGLRAIALRTHGHARALAEALRAGGVDVETGAFFDTVTARVPGCAAEVVAAAERLGVNLWQVDANRVSVTTDETTDLVDIEVVCAAFGVDAPSRVAVVEPSWPSSTRRTSAYLGHPTFHAYRSETAMLRYLRRLCDRDFALDRGMIPLGSCTMKLNATTEMAAITWPEFAHLHPFAPADQTRGIRDLVAELSEWLCRVTGYDAVSLQPNAGSQGELSGLLAIRAYHDARGDTGRTVCLIPASAHGTNAASAVMAGMQVVVVRTGRAGTSTSTTSTRRSRPTPTRSPRSWSPTPRRTASSRTRSATSAPRSTMPGDRCTSTERTSTPSSGSLARAGSVPTSPTSTSTRRSASRTAAAGPGWARSRSARTSRSTCPTTPSTAPPGRRTGVGPVSGAPFGSASILPISWAYVRLMGGAGLTRATQVAVLNANYVAARLREHYPVLYAGADGIVAHECILDLRGLTKETGVTVDDVAKRLIDYGFHAPTMSFPVAGTLMVEPTESEDRGEIDRFCDAMIAIRREVQAVADGEVDIADSVLRHAPHTAESLAGEWEHPYDRATAAFPVGVDAADKYWPPVRRVDGARGDRNLVCSCPPPEAFEA